MKYFCAECQEKHDVTEIAADLYDICIEEVRQNLPILREYESSEEFINRFMRISRFCNNPEKSRKAFMFNKSRLMQYLVDYQWTGNSVKGTLELTVAWLIDAYSSSGAAEEDEKECAELKPPVALYDLQKLSAEVKKRVLFSKDMDFVFSQVKDSPKELVYNYVGPGRQQKANAFTQRSNKRVCPHCGKNVSTAVGMAPETVVALAGSPRAGKTSCITAIASTLRSNRFLKYGLKINIDDKDEYWKRMQKNIDLFDKGCIVDKTPVDINEVPSYSYLLQIGPQKERVVTFVDMPGEFWQDGSGLSDEFFEKYGRLYQNIDCVWFFISKLAVRNLDLGKEDVGFEESGDAENRPHSNHQSKLRRESADSSDTIEGSSPARINSVLGSLRAYLESHNHVMPPFAIILTKSEVVYGENDLDEIARMGKFKMFPAARGRVIQDNLAGINESEIQAVLRHSQETGNYLLHEPNFFERSRDVRDYLHIVNDNMRMVIEQNCPRRFYISMAAYGHPAASPSTQNGGRREAAGIPEIPPTSFHEMYPLLWTLALTEGLHVLHGCSWFSPDFGGRFLRNGSGTTSEGMIQQLYRCETAPVSKKKHPSEAEMDQMQLWEDISANLLMNGKDMRRYTHTKFDHPRR